MNWKTRVLLVSLLTATLAACSSTPQITPGSERIRVLDAEPKGCIYVGEVSSVQEDKDIGTLETEMSLATRVDLRNKAHALGGNILVFLKGKNTNTLPGSAPAGKTSEVKSADSSSGGSDNSQALVFIGTVFKCPSSILNQ